MPAKGISLHIGLNAVDPNHYDGWDGQLFACENDAKVYEDVARQGGFMTTTLFTNDATSQNVLQFIREKSKLLDEGDYFFISYSGHGGSLPDLNGDEDDLKDETWCLFDRQLVDDELFEAFKDFKPGVKVVVVSDSCHSGTVTRVLLTSEQIESEKETENMFPEHKFIKRMMPANKVGPVYSKNAAIYNPILQQPPVDATSLPAFVMLFAACQDDETAKEWGDNGVFTANFKKVFSSNITSFEDLFEKIKQSVPARVQRPNFFTYGNVQYSFIKERPFNLSGNGNYVMPVNGKDAATAQTEETGLIIHTPDKVRAIDQPVTRSRDAHANANVWDDAYDTYRDKQTTRGADDINFVEPDVKTVYARRTAVSREAEQNKYLENWPCPDASNTEFVWHLDEDHSQLMKAHQAVLAKYGNDFDNPALRIRIGHVDTGYIDHVSNPKYLKKELGKSFVNKDEVKDGRDRLNTGTIAEQDGHGCATLALLGGNKIPGADAYGGYEGWLGGIPFAEIIPIRICDTVYNAFNANDVASGINYAIDNGCEVITMSMAGYPTKTVAKAVNRAYEMGVVVVTAAGNNWVRGLQKLTPKAVMYPARFDRVIAATGVAYNHEPYDLSVNNWYRTRSEGGEFMQGNWGPEKAMRTAIAGYTPNVPWASTNHGYKFSRAGGGTSSATPQVAAAAALWIVYNRDKINQQGIGNSWKKVEALRKALFSTAGKTYAEHAKYYGNGELKAFDALNVFDTANLEMSEEARVRFFGIDQFIGQWIRSRDGETGRRSAIDDENLKEMISLEIIQLLYRDQNLYEWAEKINYDSKGGFDSLTEAERKEFIAMVKQSPLASDFLKSVLV